MNDSQLLCFLGAGHSVSTIGIRRSKSRRAAANGARGVLIRNEATNKGAPNPTALRCRYPPENIVILWMSVLRIGTPAFSQFALARHPVSTTTPFQEPRRNGLTRAPGPGTAVDAIPNVPTVPEAHDSVGSLVAP